MMEGRVLNSMSQADAKFKTFVRVLKVVYANCAVKNQNHSLPGQRCPGTREDIGTKKKVQK